jgi:hypothetical protein
VTERRNGRGERGLGAVFQSYPLFPQVGVRRAARRGQVMLALSPHAFLRL